MVDSLRIKQTSTRNVEIDGWGTVITPEGSYSCLRRKSEVITTDSIFALFFGFWTLLDDIEFSEEVYEWIAKESNGITAAVTFDEFGDITDANYNRDIPTGGLPPIADFSYDDLGGGDFDFFDESSNTPTSWSRDFGDMNTSDEQDPSHTYDSSGIYEVCLTVSNDGGTDTNCQNIEVLLAPIAGYTFTDNGNGDFDFLDNSSNSPETYLWDFGDGNTSTEQNPNHIYAEPGDYTVCLTVTNAAGEDTICEVITVVFAPVADFSFTNDDVGNYSFTDLSTNDPDIWAWDFGGAGTSDEQNPDFEFTANGTYNVCLTVTNAGGSDMACQEIMVNISSLYDFENEVKLEVYPNPVNDILNINLETQLQGEFSIEFFNAIGQIVEQRTLGGAQVIDVDSWEEGLYYYQILFENEIVKSEKISVH